MINPVSTYRIQFNKQFTFANLREILPYLVKLGVRSIYASPIFEAVKDSVHGYDITNPLRINPEIGTEDELVELKQELTKNNMYWIQDIVPNHMAFDPSNAWLMDVLEKGELSEYSKFFDIKWNSKQDPDRLMVPFLGNSLATVIQNTELKTAIKEGRLFLKYYEAAYPVNFKTYLRILKEILPDKKQAKEIEEKFNGYDSTKTEELYNYLYTSVQESKNLVNKLLNKINNDPHILQAIADEQFYRLCHWQETDQKVNYRRFFTVNGLICLNIQNTDVFDKHHELILRLTKDGIFDGLRIDHIDGLFDPTEYLIRLRQKVGENIYIIVEKILQGGEQLPVYWPIQGNTGYDFLALSNNLFTNKEAGKRFSGFYHKITHERKTIEQQVYDKKAFILYELMGGELENLYQLFLKLQIGKQKELSAIHPDDLKSTIGEFLIQCPVYRYYGNKIPLIDEEAEAIQSILDKLQRAADSPGSVEILQNCFLKNPQEGNNEYNEKVEFFYKRCMQFTGPLMAKGVEDTLMYTYNKFIAHNEVGDSPTAFGVAVSDFHEIMIQRQQQWPLSLNASSTHDTKRGEDARARLNTLTYYYEEWFHLVENWQKVNADFKKNNIPDANDEYLIYQALLASHPMPGIDEPSFMERLNSYIEKALREAKTHSNWTNPNTDYENGVKEFAKKIVNKEEVFWFSFEPFFKKIAIAATSDSLSQVVLKFTCPGIPDIYQGCELWDFSFVDPDNRRSINYNKRKDNQDSLTSIQGLDISLSLSSYTDPRIKQWLITTLLLLRANNQKLFTEGEYIPLVIVGKYKDHFIAFARKEEDDILIVLLPKSGHLLKADEQNNSIFDWEDTAINLSRNLRVAFTDILTYEAIKTTKHIKLQDLLRQLPFSIIKGKLLPTNRRGAGILMHISSLPGAFGIGDMGPEAIKFVDFLKSKKQKFWQLLPLNPTEEGQGYSPYSAISSRAGNHLFISPEILVNEGLLDSTMVDQLRIPATSTVNFAEAEKIREQLLEIAFQNFVTKNESTGLFELFCKRESEWLDDFAYYILLKQLNSSKPWNEWPEEYRLKNQHSLDRLSDQYSQELQKIKWIQYIFNKQWEIVKQYCNKNKIKLIGDLPFYISYDSADVWAHKEIFEITEEGKLISVAGVPPDAFSSDGQLWGMPIYNWNVLKATNYKWWIDRISRNRELFDVIRIDHFRAFADYWTVPAGETSAKNGQWVDGPGTDFFNSVKEQLGELPFIAEDLGEVNDKVFQLRDAFNIPGMKVLQFAFGEDMPTSEYIPHNYTENFLVYTGTHDNNTTQGWFINEADAKTKRRIEQYLGRSVGKNIHELLSRLAYSSNASICILPMQDILGLGEEARMNKPASTENNWGWRVLPEQLNNSNLNYLAQWVWLYNR